MEVFLDGKVEVMQGDITSLVTDAVVNAANSTLMGGGGVDGAIHRKGGPSILEECKTIRRDRCPDGLPPGEAVITGSGSLPCGRVIHTVGPVWHGGGSGERETLGKAYRSCLVLAEEHTIKTIAFPAISTGVYGFPKALAGPIAFKAVKEHVLTRSLPEKVVFVFYSQPDLDAFLESIRRLI